MEVREEKQCQRAEAEGQRSQRQAVIERLQRDTRLGRVLAWAMNLLALPACVQTCTFCMCV